jgi:hypothetical protein
MSDSTDSMRPAAHRLFRNFLPGIAGAEGRGDLIERWLRTRRKSGNVTDEQNEVRSVLSVFPMNFVDAGLPPFEAGPYLGTARYQIVEAVVAGRPGPGDELFVEPRRSRRCCDRQSDQTIEEVLAKQEGPNPGFRALVDLGPRSNGGILYQEFMQPGEMRGSKGGRWAVRCNASIVESDQTFGQ